MPIEALADRGDRTLTFGPLKPVGFTDPRTGRRPYALLQLRAENAERSSFNLVGCQTKMTYGAQDRVFRLVPGLAHAEFLRFGSVHRNTYVNAPECLNDNLSLKERPNVYLAGQITGVEGYVESAACGLWLGLLLAARARGKKLLLPPQTTALGALHDAPQNACQEVHAFQHSFRTHARACGTYEEKGTQGGNGRPWPCRLRRLAGRLRALIDKSAFRRGDWFPTLRKVHRQTRPDFLKKPGVASVFSALHRKRSPRQEAENIRLSAADCVYYAC